MNKPTRVCECCGHPIPDAGVRAKLTPMQRRILDAVERAGQAGARRDQIMSWVYEDDPGGGPENQNILNVQRNNMAAALYRFGLQIVSTRGPGAIWKLKAVSQVRT